ncbi:uncharacterized protein LOC106636913 [Copidosoma floridanum]|uniref:uncharacterized protein LOC106636913 n=1 Tax=Copidosoma floridanum TaxID=29053 RepID=UPI000C6F7C33|nr:uncharacterized protein LOC106636913 [Copidosoma floridanum]
MVTALLPLLLSTAYFGGDRSRLFDQDFGVGLRPEQLLLSRYDYPLSARDRAIFDLFDNSNYLRMFPEVFRSSITGGLSKVYRDKDDGNWKVLIDVKQFKVEEIEVKVIDNNVVVTGKHEEKQDEHGLVSRQFVRRYEIPKDVEPDTISSEISSDGVTDYGVKALGVKSFAEFVSKYRRLSKFETTAILPYPEKMSFLPLLYSNWWEDLERPHHVRDQYFGLGLNPDRLAVIPRDFFDDPRPSRHRFNSSLRPSNYGHYYRPWSELFRRNDESGVSTVKADKDAFQVQLDCMQFAPDEINVKVVDKYIVVEGKHEEKQDEHGFISRNFTRKYLVPNECDIEKAESKLSSDGVLTICVPRKDKPAVEGERVINIQHTGKPAIKEQEKKTEEENK